MKHMEQWVAILMVGMLSAMSTTALPVPSLSYEIMASDDATVEYGEDTRRGGDEWLWLTRIDNSDEGRQARTAFVQFTIDDDTAFLLENGLAAATLAFEAYSNCGYSSTSCPHWDPGAGSEFHIRRAETGWDQATVSGIEPPRLSDFRARIPVTGLPDTYTADVTTDARDRADEQGRLAYQIRLWDAVDEWLYARITSTETGSEDAPRLIIDLVPAVPTVPALPL